jgi:hypothetical protein
VFHKSVIETRSYLDIYNNKVQPLNQRRPAMKKSIPGNRGKEKHDRTWLLNGPLGGIHLRPLAKAFGSSPATMSRIKKGKPHDPGPQLAQLIRYGVYLIQRRCRENGVEVSEWRNLNQTEGEIQSWLLENISLMNDHWSTTDAEMNETLDELIESADKDDAEVAEFLEAGKREARWTDEEIVSFRAFFNWSGLMLLIKLLDFHCEELWSGIRKSRSQSKAEFVQGVSQVAEKLERIHFEFRYRVAMAAPVEIDEYFLRLAGAKSRA